MLQDSPPPVVVAPGGRRLSELAALRFCGADAASFLQGQLSADINALDGKRWDYAAYCSPKGRMICGMLVWRESEDSIVALTAADLADSVAQRLRMFVLRAKVSIAPAAGAVFAVFGEDWNPAAENAVERFESITKISQAKVAAAIACPHFLVFADGEDGIKQAAARFGDDGDSAAWRRAQIAGGIAWVTAATREMFIPQTVNYDCIGGINFRKGCYVGQEIIARLRYRGKVKRRMLVVVSTDDAPPVDGSPLVDGDNQPAGNIVLAASRDGGGYIALAGVRLDARDFRVDGEAALSVCRLPYSLDEDGV
ncbi:MAG: YgfZ/GcvT domain-containing protein [Gammaproteobacteria bacterium]